MGDVIRAFHRYRNDAYHRDKIRRETIHTAASVYFEVACDLLVALPPGQMIFSSEDDWSDFYTQYGLPFKIVRVPEDVAAIAATLKSRSSITGESLAARLSKHLTGRLDAIAEQIDHQRNVTPAADVNEELARIQLWKERSPISWSDVQRELKTYSPKFTSHDLVKWRNEATEIGLADTADNLPLMKRFCTIEKEFEPLEELVNEVATLLDGAIQLEIDRGRGK